MADVFGKSKRSEVMSAIRATGNRKTELEMIRIFRSRKITGWRRGQRLRFLVAGKGRIGGVKTASIRPDFVFRHNGVALFVDGEFWHGHPTKAKIPGTRCEWWAAKIEGNKQRDRLQNRLLGTNGWKVVRIWQHELTKKHLHKALRKLRRAGLMEDAGDAGSD